MALKIIKLAVSSETKMATSPTVTRFFYEVPEKVAHVPTLKIDAGQLLDDTGQKVASLPELNINNSYFNVYINGVLQMEDNFAYTAGEEGIGNLLISLPDDTEIAAGTPIILEVINFNPTLKTTFGT